MSGTGGLAGLIGFWNQQNVQSVSPKVTVPAAGRVRKWDPVPAAGSGRKWEVSTSPGKKWEPSYLKSPVIKKEVPKVICSPPVNKWETPSQRGGFAKEMESGRVSEGSERSDGGEGEGGATTVGSSGLRNVSGSPTSSPSPSNSPSSPSFASPRLAKTNSSPFSRFQQMEDKFTRSNLGKGDGCSLSRNSSLPASPRPTSLTLPSSGGTAARSGSGAKELILTWVQDKLKDYPIPITNFSTCWNDGLAFCAIIHVFYPDNFDWFALKAENRRYNFTLGFEKAEELADIYPLLEVDDMVRFQNPDWKCVFTYVQSFYRRFREDRYPSPRQGHKSPVPSQAYTQNSGPVSPTKETSKTNNMKENENKEEDISEETSSPSVSKAQSPQVFDSSSPPEDTSDYLSELSKGEINRAEDVLKIEDDNIRNKQIEE